jgi:hypothetical protein
MDELGSERHLQAEELRVPGFAVEARNRHEEVQELGTAFGRIPPEGVAAARKARHHRLGNTRGKACGDGSIGRIATPENDVQADLSRGRMARRDPRSQSGRPAVPLLFARQGAESVAGRAPHLC